MAKQKTVLFPNHYGCVEWAIKQKVLFILNCHVLDFSIKAPTELVHCAKSPRFEALPTLMKLHVISLHITCMMFMVFCSMAYVMCGMELGRLARIFLAMLGDICIALHSLLCK